MNTGQANELNDMGLGSLRALPSRKSLGQHVFENLKQAIVRGEMTPGSRIVESRIADALGISRTPVREAIHKLEREGLLRRLPRGGFTVMSLSREDIEETFGIRSALESYAARLAALRHKEDELLPLEEKVKEYQRCLDNRDLNPLPEINTEFHNRLYAMSRSPKLIKMINDLKDQIYRFRKILLRVEEMAATINEDHRQMLKAMKKKPSKKESLVTDFEAHLVKPGLVPDIYLGVLKRLEEMKKLVRSGKVMDLQKQEILMHREYVRKFIHEAGRILKKRPGKAGAKPSEMDDKNDL